MIPHRFILPILPWWKTVDDLSNRKNPICLATVSHDIRYPVSSQYSVSSMPTVFLGVSTIPMLFTYTILHNDVAVIKLFDICPMFLFHWRWRQNYDTVVPLYIAIIGVYPLVI